MQPLLTIAIPTYNRAEQAKRQILDMLKQSRDYLGKEVELLVSNNASTDDTDKVIRSIASKSFTYYKQETNLGLVGNVIFLSKQAHGIFFWALSDDDLIRPDIVSYIIDIIKTYPDIAGIFLKICTGHQIKTADNVTWDKAVLTISQNNIVKYDKCNTLKDFPHSKTWKNEGDWLFITKCIIKDVVYKKISQDNKLFCNLATPLIAACVAVRNTSFYYDKSFGSIFCGLAKSTWQGIFSDKLCDDLAIAINEMKRWKISDDEIKDLFIAFEDVYYENALASVVYKKLPISCAINKCYAYQKEHFSEISTNRIINILSKDNVAVIMTLSTIIIDIGNNKAQISDYFHKKKELLSLGIKIGRLREIKWFIKYFIYKRYFCR